MMSTVHPIQCCFSTIVSTIVQISYINSSKFNFLRATAVPAGTAEARISYGNSVCPSVCLYVCLSRPGGIPRPDEIETPGLHHMIARSL